MYLHAATIKWVSIWERELEFRCSGNEKNLCSHNIFLTSFDGQSILYLQRENSCFDLCSKTSQYNHIYRHTQHTHIYSLYLFEFLIFLRISLFILFLINPFIVCKRIQMKCIRQIYVKHSNRVCLKWKQFARLRLFRIKNIKIVIGIN